MDNGKEIILKKMKNKYIIILTFLIAGLFLFFYFKPFSSSEIIVLDHLTEYENGSIDQICLVKHPPASSTKLKELIEEFNKNNLAEDRKFRRLFIKEHDNIFLPGLFLSENIDYYLKTIKRDDLDNIDFLGRSYSSETIDGKPHKSTVVYVGKIYYYKE